MQHWLVEANTLRTRARVSPSAWASLKLRAGVSVTASAPRLAARAAVRARGPFVMPAVPFLDSSIIMSVTMSVSPERATMMRTLGVPETLLKGFVCWKSKGLHWNLVLP